MLSHHANSKPDHGQALIAHGTSSVSPALIAHGTSSVSPALITGSAEGGEKEAGSGGDGGPDWQWGLGRG